MPPTHAGRVSKVYRLIDGSKATALQLPDKMAALMPTVSAQRSHAAKMTALLWKHMDNAGNSKAETGANVVICRRSESGAAKDKP